MKMSLYSKLKFYGKKRIHFVPFNAGLKKMSLFKATV